MKRSSGWCLALMIGAGLCACSDPSGSDAGSQAGTGAGTLATAGITAGVTGAGNGGTAGMAGMVAAGEGGMAGSFAGSGAGVGMVACTADQMAAACGSVQCGEAPSCGVDCGACTGDDVCVSGACVPVKCGKLELMIDTYAACAVNITEGTELDGEAFIPAGDTQQRVLAMDRLGMGHVMAWCDASVLSDLITKVNARGYLGRSPTARIASFGDDFQCNPMSPSAHPVPDWITYFGTSLPDLYLGDPAKLREDWDGIIFCGFRADWNAGWTSLLHSYVSEHGGGFLGVLDYAGFDVMHEDFVNMAGILAPAGIGFDEVVLDQATAAATVSNECVPDYQPGPD